MYYQNYTMLNKFICLTQAKIILGLNSAGFANLSFCKPSD